MILRKLRKDNRVRMLLVASLIVVIMLVANPFGMYGYERVYDINTVGSVKAYQTGSSVVLTTTSTVDAEIGITVVFIPNDIGDIRYIDAYIYKYSGSYLYADNMQKGSMIKSTDRYIFTFNLGPLPVGTGKYYVGFSGELYSPEDYTYIITGHTSYFTVNKASAVIYADPEITQIPDDLNMVVGQSVALTWKYICEGPAVIKILKNGIQASSKDISGSVIEQMYQYTFVMTTLNDIIITMQIIPDNPSNNIASDTVNLYAFETGTTTTTITTTTTTTNMDTTTTTITESPIEYKNIIIIGGVIVIGSIVVFFVIRRRSSMGMSY